MIIRHATPEDAAEIYVVHASNEGSMPWNNAEDCGEHIQWMIGRGTPPVVAEMDGLLVGEMEVWWGEDVPEFGRTVDISMLYVHRDRQRQGTGTSLIQHAINLSKDKDCQRVTVWTDPDAMGFYRKQGFAPRLLLRRFSVATSSVRGPGRHKFRPTKLADLVPANGAYLQTQRILHPRQRWSDLTWDEAEPPRWKGSYGRRPSIFTYLVDMPEQPEPAIAVYRLTHWRPDPEAAELFLWSPVRREDLLLSSIAHAATIGIKELSVLAYGDAAYWLEAAGAEVKGEEQVLARRV